MSYLEKLIGLNWLAPNFLIPHGISGLVTISTGLILVAGSLTGNFIFLNSYLFFVFLISTLLNTLSGFYLSKNAPKES
jgi:hypothetical protein